jgi:hypothetical protein
MSIEEFKEALITPLKKSIEQHKSAALIQFRSRDDLTKQWDRAEGLEMALNHIDNVYNSLSANSPTVEIIPPQN